MIEHDCGNIALHEQVIIIVEGWEDECFFNALISHMRLRGIQIVKAEGKTKIPNIIRLLKVSPGYDEVTVVAIVMDADTNPSASYQSACTHLSREGLPVPSNIAQLSDGTPKTCIYLLPSKDRPGELEDLCLDALSSQPEMACVDGFFLCLGGKGFSYPGKESKAKVVVFLAATETKFRLGAAFSKARWPWDDIAFDDIKHFLELINDDRQRQLAAAIPKCNRHGDPSALN